jgi:tousled-like kinase
MNKNNLKILNRKYAVLELIGKGGSSEVMKAIDIKTNKEVVLKVLKVETIWSQEK